jgi:multicomponent Na+:H+ antiporter subunit D
MGEASFALVLAVAWAGGAAIAFLDGRRRGVGEGAALVLAAVLALDLALLARLAHGGTLELVTGGWPAGIGIRLRADALAMLFASASQLVLLAVLVHELLGGVRHRTFPALLLFLSAGMHGLFLTGDAFNFYVFFELSMVSSFALASYGRHPAEVRATFVFVVVNLIGSVVFLAAVAALYHATGTLDLAALADESRRGERSLLLFGVLLFTAFLLKLGLFPFHYWVAVVYRDTRPAVAAALAGALANVGSYGILRFGAEALRPELESARGALLALGAVSALYGTLLALRRRIGAEIVAYASVAHAGYLLLALGIGGSAGKAALVLLVLSGSLDKATLFLTLDLPGASGRFAALAGGLSLAGLPLTLGFLGKLELLRAALGHARAGVLVPVLLAAGALGSVLVFRSWHRLPGGHRRSERGTPGGARGAVAVALAGGLVALTACGGPLRALIETAVRPLLVAR